MDSIFDEREDFLAAQSLAFALFCRACSAEPDEAFLELLCGDAVGGLLNLEKSRCSWAEDVEVECAALLEGPAEVALDGLRTDYTALYLGPKTLPAPIWETVYRTGRSELFT